VASEPKLGLRKDGHSSGVRGVHPGFRVDVPVTLKVLGTWGRVDTLWVQTRPVELRTGFHH
jgi:hypothetical protein